jgi:hypothetical protein
MICKRFFLKHHGMRFMKKSSVVIFFTQKQELRAVGQYCPEWRSD